MLFGNSVKNLAKNAKYQSVTVFGAMRTSSNDKSRQRQSVSELTIRQRRFLEELPRCKSLAEAARKAGYSPKFAGQAGYLTLQRIGQKAPELLKNIEITLEELIEKNIKPGLEATKTTHIQYRGKITAEIVQPDWRARLEMTKLCLLLHAAYPAKTEKPKNAPSDQSITFYPRDHSGTP